MASIGRYEIEREIGRGSMGIVYLAHDPHVRRRVAIKTFLLPPGLTSQQEREYSARFLREAQAAGALSHPSIVTIFDADTDPERGVPFIVMEYVEGGSLRDMMIRAQRLEPDRALAMVSALADALRVAHEEGIVHRDIKPANVLLRARDGQAKIVDFGVARMSTSELTGAGDVFGSPAYMSPEQFRGAAVDARSDLFSLGTILYQTLCGERPFAGDDMSSLAYSVVHTPAPPIAHRLPGAPHEVDRFFEKALAKEPEDRFPDAGAFRDAVEELRRALALHTTIALSAHDARRAFAQPSPIDSAFTWLGRTARTTMEKVQRAMAGSAGAETAAASSAGSAGPGASARAYDRKAMPAEAYGRGKSGITRLEGLLAITMLLLAILPGLWAFWSPSSPEASALGLTTAGRGVSGADAAPDAADRRASAHRNPARSAASTGDRASRPPSRAAARPASETAASSTSRTGRTLPQTAQGSPGAPKTTAARPVRYQSTSPDSGQPRSVSVSGTSAAPAPDPPAAPQESTRASLAAPLSLSSDSPGRTIEPTRASGTLVIDARSLVKEGTVKVLVDGREVYHRRLSSLEGEGAQPKKLFHRREETFTVRLEVAPGYHTVAAQVFSEGKAEGREDAEEIRVQAHETAHLLLVAGRILGASVSLKSD